MKREENHKKSGPQPEPPEPTAGRGASPIWLLAVLGLLFYWGTLYLDANGGGFDNRVYGQFASARELESAQPKTGDWDKAAGERVFNQICAQCHQASGMGSPGQYPPLVGSEWVTAAGPNRIIRIVLNGLVGPLKVKGEDWNHNMVGLPQLTDKEIAAVISFIRTKKDWGHSGSIVKPEQVAAIRAIVGGRDNQWTADELEKIPESD